MKSLNGSKTKENLLFAFIGESQARNKYGFFASVAKKEGYQAIGKIFEDTAAQEKEHAERLFEFLEDTDPVEIHDVFSSGKIGTTAENLTEAMNGEEHEFTEMYPSFAKVANEEGYTELAAVFNNIAKAEVYHGGRFKNLLEQVETKTLLEKNDLVAWKCTNCGYHITAKGAPKVCPACGHAQGYFIAVSDLLF
ncbi:MAG: rubrerythrin family protein [Rickettsiales bacterium]|nr:MAG: rubrerythrin family protein [Rickettsiales bacterium]